MNLSKFNAFNAFEEQLTNENVFLVSCSKCGEILGYQKEREKEEYEEHTSVSSSLSTMILVLIR